MSTYLQAKAAVLDTVRAFDSDTFDEANTSRDDFRVRDDPRGVAAVVQTVEDTVEADWLDGTNMGGYGSHGAYQERHTFGIHLFKTIGTGQTGLPNIVTELETLTEALKDYLRPTLRALPGVRDVRLPRTARPGTVSGRSADAPEMYMQTIVVVMEYETDEDDE